MMNVIAQSLQQFLLTGFWLLAVLVTVLAGARVQEAAVAAPTVLKITASGHKGQSPAVARSATSGEIMIVFNDWTSNKNKKDPYYAVSTNGGTSFSTPAPIITAGTPTADSLSLDVIYDGSTAHAVWIELNEVSPSNFTYQVYYGKRAGSGSFSSIQAISSAQPTPINQAVIASTGTNKLTIIWDQNNGRNILQNESIDGGSTFSGDDNVPVFTTAAPLLAMSLEGDTSGNLHLSWEQQTISGGSDVYYRKRVGSTWQAQLLLTSDPTLADESHAPRAITLSSDVAVAITARDASDDQTIYVRTCALSSNCTSDGNWTAAQLISGQTVGVNALLPFYVFPNLVVRNGKLVVAYHGIGENQVAQKEVVWINSNACAGWADTQPSGLTADSVSSLNPAAALIVDEIGLAYEVIDTGNDNQIYYMAVPVECTVYMPVIVR